MPLPRVTEQAATGTAAIGKRIDQLLVEHLESGRRLPSPSQFVASIRRDVTAAVTAAMLDIDPDTPQTVIDDAVAVAIDETVVLYQRARTDTRRRRREIRRELDRPVDDDEERVTLVTLPRIAASAGFAAAFAALIRRRRRVPRDRIQQAAARAGRPLERRLEASLKTAIRTKSAELRNEWAADIAERDGLVLFIRDAFKGQDKPCVDANRKYATPEWLRRHPVVHPNCTREGRPVTLPPGERVTLLR